MQPNAQGMCFTYYGMYNNNIKPRLGVSYFMIDEHVKKIVDKAKDEFKIDVFDILSNFNKQIKELIKKSEEKIDNIYKVVAESGKQLDKVIELNALKKPTIIVNKSKKVIKKPVEDDESGEDLL